MEIGSLFITKQVGKIKKTRGSNIPLVPFKSLYAQLWAFYFLSPDKILPNCCNLSIQALLSLEHCVINTWFSRILISFKIFVSVIPWSLFYIQWGIAIANKHTNKYKIIQCAFIIFFIPIRINSSSLWGALSCVLIISIY